MANDRETLNETPEDDILADYIDRLIRGETLNPDLIIAAHPKIGPELLEQLRAFECLNDPQPGTPLGTLGDYTLNRQVGRGGMGVVYEAWQGSMERQVALKVLPMGVAANEKSLHRFVREAKTAGQLNHPNIVQVHGMGVEEQTPYYAMEYVEGDTLAQVLRQISEIESEAKTRFGKKDDLRYFANLAEAFADVADGLQHAHSRGVIHRDIKPSNLILDSEGRLRILDFGLAHLEGQESLTLSGDIIGTPSYMSPEQARARKDPIDHRTDVYSLGATMYEALTLKPPFKGKSHQDTMSQIIEQDPLVPTKLNPRIPEDLETIVLKCLRKDPGNRYGTAEASAQDLRRFVRGDPIEARPQSGLEKLGKRMWLYKGILTASTLVLLLITAGLAVSNTIITRARDDARYDGYVSSVRLAHEDWKAGRVARMRELLEDQIPEGEEADLRGWEWYYLKSLCQSERLTLLGHSWRVRCVDWSPDGRWIASSGYDGKIRIWDAASGEAAFTLIDNGRENPVGAVAWSPDGRLLATGDSKGAVSVWDFETRKKLHSLAGHSGGDLLLINALSWHPEAPVLASACDNSTVKIWDTESGAEIKTIDLSNEAPRRGMPYIWAVAFSPDGSALLIDLYSQGGISIWRTADWSQVKSISSGDEVYGLAWAPDSEHFASTSGREVKVWDRDGNSVRTLRGARERLWAVAWSSANELAAAGEDGIIKIWDAETGEERFTLRGHEGTVRWLDWSPDGNSIASGSHDFSVKVWDPTRDQDALRLGASFRFVWHPHESLLLVRGPERRGLEFFDTSGEALGSLLSSEDALPIDRMSLAADGRRLAVARPGDVLELIDAETGAVFWRKEVAPERLRGLALSPDSRFLAIGHEAGFAVLDTLDGEEHTNITIGPRARVLDFAFSPDSERLATAGKRQYVTVWDVSSGERGLVLVDRPYVYAHNLDAHTCVAWSPDGLLLAVGDDQGLILVFDAQTGTEVYRKQGNTSSLNDVTFSPDGRRLASASADSTVKIWDPATGSELLSLDHRADRFRHGIGQPWRVAWSADGRVLATGMRGSGSGGVALWDAGPGYESE